SNNFNQCHNQTSHINNDQTLSNSHSLSNISCKNTANSTQPFNSLVNETQKLSQSNSDENFQQSTS
ncbi:hypothetical protein HELRODRAFT_150292, partial [Helobdella robusta]